MTEVKLLGVVAGYVLYFLRQVEFERKLSILKLRDIRDLSGHDIYQERALHAVPS